MLPKAYDPKSTEDPTPPRKSGASPGKPQLSKIYDPSSVEDRIYKMWEESGAFRADNTSKKEPFTISMPPPNATGQLHLGHAVILALGDIFIRFARMRGKEALWIPGTDHAAIATESVVIRKIQKEEKIPDPRGKLGREELLRRIHHFVEESKDTIRKQVRKMGASCDWSREAFTMEPALNRIVNEVFVKMYEDGLIYRGERVVNWDTALQTTISDDEIEYEDTEGILYTIEYVPASETGGDPLYVATSRPETKLGDNALAVHPDDARYKHLIGRHFKVRWPHGHAIHVTVIGDHQIDPQFGTGIVGVTPFHSKIDFEMWQRHKETVLNAPLQVIGEDGCMTESVGPYVGLTVEKCREQFVADLREEGRIRLEEKYMQPLSISYRSKKPVEPLPKLQWFVDVDKKLNVWQGKWKGKNMSLKDVMQDVIKNGDVRIIPDRFEKTYFHWIDNLRDWCISRQIWWGHRIPVWYCKSCQSSAASVQSIQKCEKCGGTLEQDPDTLDTWFSSALWTWSTLIDKNLAEDFSLSLQDLLTKSPDFQKFHPTHVMETGYDILFFWVARMILMTTYATGQIPFETVYLNGLVRTRDGKKMSKSDPSTCIDPLEMITKYGADALRMSMIVGQSAGNDFRLYEEKIAGYRNFMNKLWNVSRFVLMQCDQAKIDPHEVSAIPTMSELPLADRAILHALDLLIQDATKGLEIYNLSEVGEKLYSFVWDTFCDWYLELSKENANLTVLIHIFRTLLILLHPYCPFVTEELWSHVNPKDAGMLIGEAWLKTAKGREDPESYVAFQLLIDVISAIRKIRADQGIDPGKHIAVILHTKKWIPLLESQESHIRRLARVGSLTIDTRLQKHEQTASEFLKDVEVHVPLAGLIDVNAEKKKLMKEKENLERFINGIQMKLGNTDFMARAPATVVESERWKLKEAQEKLAKIEKRLSTF